VKEGDVPPNDNDVRTELRPETLQLVLICRVFFSWCGSAALPQETF
jgi:hypothetical protein